LKLTPWLIRYISRKKVSDREAIGFRERVQTGTTVNECKGDLLPRDSKNGAAKKSPPPK
jgi:hypothetical protein